MAWSSENLPEKNLIRIADVSEGKRVGWIPAWLAEAAFLGPPCRPLPLREIEALPPPLRACARREYWIGGQRSGESSRAKASPIGAAQDVALSLLDASWTLICRRLQMCLRFPSFFV